MQLAIILVGPKDYLHHGEQNFCLGVKPFITRGGEGDDPQAGFVPALIEQKELAFIIFPGVTQQEPIKFGMDVLEFRTGIEKLSILP